MHVWEGSGLRDPPTFYVLTVTQPVSGMLVSSEPPLNHQVMSPVSPGLGESPLAALWGLSRNMEHHTVAKLSIIPFGFGFGHIS